MSTAPTPRQLEAMLSIFRGRPYAERVRELAGGFHRRYASSMGGAGRRRLDRMGEAGWLVEHEALSGRTYYKSELTSAGLRALAAGLANRPELLPEHLEHATKLAEDREADQASAAQRRAAEVAARNRERAEVRHLARSAAMREIAQSYQISLDALTDDQCVALWNEIVEREMAL